MNEIKCPCDLNQFLLGEPLFENTFPEEECEEKKFYGDCFHCFATAIAKRDQKLKLVENKELAKFKEKAEKMEIILKERLENLSKNTQRDT